MNHLRIGLAACHLVILFVYFSAGDARAAPSNQKKSAAAVLNAARKIACDIDEIQQTDVIPFAPEMFDPGKETYAVHWHGDYGCQHASHSEADYVAVVAFDAIGHYKIYMLYSSIPAISKLTRLIGATAKTVTIDAWELGPLDVLSDPSLHEKITIETRDALTWTLVKRVPIAAATNGN